MDELNEKEWKELQERVKEQDKKQSNRFGVNFSTIEFNVELEKEWKEIQEAVKKADRKVIGSVYIKSVPMARIKLDKKKEKEV